MLKRYMFVKSFKTPILAATVLTLLNCSCTGTHSNSESDTGTMRHDDDFHADYDIAMTVGSLADALRVGEPMDSTYNFRDLVLTDGTGRPLYSTLNGHPGTWTLTAISDTSVMLRNDQIGDLATDDLKRYLLDSSAAPSVTDYRINDRVEARFNTRVDTAPNGLTGPMLTLTLIRENI